MGKPSLSLFQNRLLRFGMSAVTILFIFLLILPAGRLWSQAVSRVNAADLLSNRIVDDSSLRISLEFSWLKELPARVLSKRPEVYTLRGGTQIQVRIETSAQNRDEFAIVFARQYNGSFVSWAQGSWSLIRRRDNSPEDLRIIYFPRSDYNTYIQFRPFSNERSVMDVVVYDSYVVRSLPVPVPFDRLYVLPVEDVLASLGPQFPRRYFDPDPGMYRDSRAFVSAVRSGLPELVYVDDGAIDEAGRYVYINSLLPQDPYALADSPGRGGLNCSGFAKWVVDGILRPFTNSRLQISPLKAPFGERGSSAVRAWEELRDPFFGLDWCRNLASQAAAILRSPGFGTLDEIEVRIAPFSQVLRRQDGITSLSNYPGYVQNAGFGFEGLHPLLYTLAIDEPGMIYLAAVNEELGAPVTPDNPRGLPRMRQYYHVAVLVPYFSERGVFQVAVFESASETSITQFKNRYPGQFVNLVRIPIEGRFDP